MLFTIDQSLKNPDFKNKKYGSLEVRDQSAVYILMHRIISHNKSLFSAFYQFLFVYSCSFLAPEAVRDRWLI
jgi:hypothetical protein